MGFRVQVLGTSSSGNCALIESRGARVLLDAGFSGRRLEGMLKEVGKPIESIDAVFLTHEHSDHTAGLRGLSRHRHLRFFANHATAQVCQSRLSTDLQWMLFETGTRFEFKDLSIETILLPHDAMEPVGYTFKTGGDDLFDPHASIAWIMDLGHAPAALGDLVRDVQLLVLEANHDSQMLEENPHRPYPLKQRISGRHGHLSNQAAKDFLNSVKDPQWRRVLLGHLSKDCNDPEQVRQLIGNGDCSCRVECLNPEKLIFPEIDLADL